MTSSNVSDLVSFARLSRSVNSMKTRADQLRVEAVTGQREDITKATKGDVGGAHLMNKAIEDVKNYQELLKISQLRAERTQSSLGALSGEAVRIGAETIAANGLPDHGALKALAADARAGIYNAFSVLNVSDSGRSLFGGDVTNQPPFGDPEQFIADIEAIIAGATDAADAEAQLDTYFNDPAGGFETNIYQGGDNDASQAEISPGVRLDISVRGNAQPIKDLLRGLAVIATHESATFEDSSTLIETAASTTLSAELAITNLRSQIGVGEARMEAAMARYEAEETVLTALYGEKLGVDQYEAASELQMLESQLEASYLLTARLARLSLSNYL